MDYSKIPNYLASPLPTSSYLYNMFYVNKWDNWLWLLINHKRIIVRRKKKYIYIYIYIFKTGIKL